MSDTTLARYDIAPRPLSRLSYQIMGLNLMALAILIVGVFYLDQYKKDLTSSETELLATEAQLYASVISDNTLNNGQFDLPKAREIFNSFGMQKTQRLRMFSDSGKLLIDTKTPYAVSGQPYKKVFPGIIGAVIDELFSTISDALSVNFQLPFYPATFDEDMNSFPGASDALKGNIVLSAWQSREGGLILSTATPVKKNDQIFAVIVVTRADTKIQQTFAVMRVGIIQFFLGSLLVTLLFSLYLSASIGHPLRKLASAAEAVRENRNADTIPDLSYRKDEIGELSLSLREMALALQNRIESIERFAADVSHELKNPLTSLRSAIETLEKVSREEDRKKLMGIVMHDLVRMDRLISDISHASRLDVELLREVLQPVDLRKVILPLLDAYRDPMDRAGNGTPTTAAIQCKGLDHAIMVLGQKVRLTQIFENLISNALSFSPDGKPVLINVTKGTEYVVITVDDFGPGIPENRLEKIFERFYSERPEGETFGSHSGLGLSIVRQIVEAHDGTIEAQNRMHNGIIEGARFIVTLRTA